MKANYAVAVVALSLMTATAGAKDVSSKIKVYVTVRETDGFLNATEASTESANHLREAMRGDKQFIMVAKKEDADVIVRLTARNGTTTASGNTTAIIPVGDLLITTGGPRYFTDYWLSVDLEIGPTYKREFKGYSSKNYKECAKAVVRDVSVWTAANVEQIRTLGSTK